YEIWKKNGNIGSELDFLESLKGEKGEDGNAGSDSDKNWVHDQFTPESVWVINHPLNKKVAVTVTDTAGTVVEGEVTINDGTMVIVKFNAPFKGEAILN